MMPRKPAPASKKTAPKKSPKPAAKAAAKAPTPAEPSARKAKANALVEAGRRSEDLRAKRGRALVADVRARMRRVGDEFLEIGRAFRTILDEQLYRALGYDSFKQLLAGERLGSNSQASKLMGVAEVFAHVGLDDFEFERAAALIAYTRATPEDDNAAELLAANRTIAGKPVREHTVADLLRAGREAAANEAAKQPQTPAQKARAARERHAVKQVAAAHKAAKLPSAEVVVRAGKVVATWELDTLAPPSDE